MQSIRRPEVVFIVAAALVDEPRTGTPDQCFLHKEGLVVCETGCDNLNERLQASSLNLVKLAFLRRTRLDRPVGIFSTALPFPNVQHFVVARVEVSVNVVVRVRFHSEDCFAVENYGAQFTTTSSLNKPISA